MRSSRIGLVAATLAAALLVPAATATGVAEAPPTRVTVGSNQEPPTLNPFVPGGDNAIVQLIGQAVWARGWVVDPVANRQLPEVFTQLPTVDNGGVVDNGPTLTITYEIRPEAKWADGKAISGDDLAFTIETVLRPRNIADRTTWKDIDRDSISVSERGISFDIDNRSLEYLRLFEVIIPKHDVEGSGFLEDWNTTMWVSAGPYRFAEWAIGERLKLERNPDYWKADVVGRPAYDEVVFEFQGDERELRRAFERRDIDVYEPQFDQVARLEPLEADGAQIAVNPGTIWEHINFQFGPGRLERNEHSLTEYRRFRRAVAHAVDREALARDLHGGHIGALGSFWDVYDEQISTGAWDRYDHDPQQAATLISSLCADVDCGPDGPTLVFTTTTNNDIRASMAEKLRLMIEAAGINYVVDLEDSQIFFGETLDNGTWDIGEWAWVGFPTMYRAVEMLDNFDPEGPPLEGSNFYRWGTPDSSVRNAPTRRFADIRDEAADAVTLAEVIPMLQAAEDILAEQMVILPLYGRPHVVAYWADAILGVSAESHGSGPLTWNIDRWRPRIPDQVCDFDGDGFPDVAFAAPLREVDGIEDAGAVYVTYGGAAGLTQRVQTWTQNTPGVNGVAQPFDHFGSTLACGDFNRDGYSDLAVGNGDDMFGGERTGTVNVLFGAAAGLSADNDELWHRDRGGVPGEASESDAFGQALAVGDFNADGYDDLGVGIPATDRLRGAALVLDGSSDGLTTDNTWLIQQGASSPGSDGTVNGTPQRTDLFGLSLDSADLNRDGFADLVIGAPFEGVAGKGAAGQVHVVWGSEKGVTSDDDLVINTNKKGVRGKVTNALFGVSLATGDFNGDTYADLAIGAPSARRKDQKAGQVHVFYGDGSGISFAGDQIWHQNRPGIGEQAETDDFFGNRLAVGDHNGDGYEDLLIGAPGEDRPGKPDAGQVHIVFGGTGGLSVDIPSLTVRQRHLEFSFTEAGDGFGTPLAAADVNADGFVDFLVAAMRETILGVEETGRVDAILGNPDGGVESDGRWWGIGMEGIPGVRAERDGFGGAIAG